MNKPQQTVLPRWRGFNLLDFFTMKSACDPVERDYRWIAGWGFDFVRLPCCYTLWSEGGDPYRPLEPVLQRLDRAIACGRAHGLHVSLNLHRAPGYSVNREREEPYSLWKDQLALDAFCFQWRMFAERYCDIPANELSFDLVNEPPGLDETVMTRADHERVVRAALEAIREVNPDRIVIADGHGYGNHPFPELANLPLAQSCRGYSPYELTHYRASWCGRDDWPEPAWPMVVEDKRWDATSLAERYDEWLDLAELGVGVHCGEFGAYKRTPHAVALSWMEALLSILYERNIGYALWNLRGPFGILDSDRADVMYDDWHGHALDRAMLELLQQY